MPPKRQPHSAAISDEEWERVRPTIRRLFLVEEKSLKELMADLERLHQLKPSKAQLTWKLQQWHISKNMSKAEWKYVLAKIKKRERQKKRSWVFLSGVPLSLASIENARARHGYETTLERLLPQRPPSPKNVSIVVRTPPPQDFEALGLDSLPWMKFRDAFQASRVVPQALEIVGDPNVPLVDLIRELTLSDPEADATRMSLVQQTSQILAIAMPEEYPGAHVFRAEGLIHHPGRPIFRPELLELLLYTLSNGLFLMRVRYKDVVRQDQPGQILELLQRSTFWDLIRAHRYSTLPLSLQAALCQLLSLSICLSDMRAVRALLRCGVPVDQPLPMPTPGAESRRPLELAAYLLDVEIVKILLDLSPQAALVDIDVVSAAFNSAYRLWADSLPRPSRDEWSFRSVVDLILSRYTYSFNNEAPVLAMLDTLAVKSLQCPSAIHKSAQVALSYFMTRLDSPAAALELFVAAIKLRDNIAVKSLMERVIEQELVNLRTKRGESILRAAVSTGNHGICLWALQLGASPDGPGCDACTKIGNGYPNPWSGPGEAACRATPLQCAAFAADEDILELLLQYGANVNFRHTTRAYHSNFDWTGSTERTTPWNCTFQELNDWRDERAGYGTYCVGQTALQAAIHGMQSKSAVLLLKRGAALAGNEPLMAFALHDHELASAMLTSYKSPLTSSLLLEHSLLFGKVHDLDRYPSDALTPWALLTAIYTAPMQSIDEIISPLLSRGKTHWPADDPAIGAALALAANYNRLDVVLAILEAGLAPQKTWADIPLPRSEPRGVDGPETLGGHMWPYWLLRLRLRREFELLSAPEHILHPIIGAVFFYAEPPDATVTYSPDAEKLETLKLLQKSGYAAGSCCLGFAARSGSLRVLQWLHGTGCSLWEAEDLFRHALHGAEVCTEWLMHVLLETRDHGNNCSAALERPWAYGCLTTALCRRKFKLVERLLELGAPVGVDGYFALRIAAGQGYFGFVQRLLELGTDPNQIPCLQGQEIRGIAEFLWPWRPGQQTCTPLELAAWKGRLDIVQLLLSHGAGNTGEGSAPSRQLLRAVKLAGRGGHLVVAQMLRSQGQAWTEDVQRVFDELASDDDSDIDGGGSEASSDDDDGDSSPGSEHDKITGRSISDETDDLPQSPSEQTSRPRDVTREQPKEVAGLEDMTQLDEDWFDMYVQYPEVVT